MWLNQVIEEFGKQLNLSKLGFHGSDILCLEMEQSGKLFIEKCPQDRLVIYLVQKRPFMTPQLLKSALMNVKTSKSFLATTGIKGEEDLIFAIDIPLRQTSLQNLNAIILQLKDLQQQTS